MEPTRFALQDAVKINQHMCIYSSANNHIKLFQVLVYDDDGVLNELSYTLNIIIITMGK